MTNTSENLIKRYLIQLLQLPVAFFFGYLTDFGVWALQWMNCGSYLEQWLICILGILLVAAALLVGLIAKRIGRLHLLR